MATPSRAAVARTLHLVFGEGSRVPEAWDAGLAIADAGLANALLGLCLRRWGCLQAYVRPQLRDPGRGLPLGTQVVLAMGLAQLAWLPGISDHAAVNEVVDLATDRQMGFPPHKGLVNALLRRAAKDRPALKAALEGLDPALDRSPFTRRVLQAALAPWGGGPVDDLWRRLDSAAAAFDIDWRWVKGHAGHEGNELADALATRGAIECGGSTGAVGVARGGSRRGSRRPGRGRRR